MVYMVSTVRKTACSSLESKSVDLRLAEAYVPFCASIIKPQMIILIQYLGNIFVAAGYFSTMQINMLCAFFLVCDCLLRSEGVFFRFIGEKLIDTNALAWSILLSSIIVDFYPQPISNPIIPDIRHMDHHRVAHALSSKMYNTQFHMQQIESAGLLSQGNLSNQIPMHTGPVFRTSGMDNVGYDTKVISPVDSSHFVLASVKHASGADVNNSMGWNSFMHTTAVIVLGGWMLWSLFLIMDGAIPLVHCNPILTFRKNIDKWRLLARIQHPQCQRQEGDISPGEGDLSNKLLECDGYNLQQCQTICGMPTTHGQNASLLDKEWLSLCMTALILILLSNPVFHIALPQEELDHSLESGQSYDKHDDHSGYGSTKYTGNSAYPSVFAWKYEFGLGWTGFMFSMLASSWVYLIAICMTQSTGNGTDLVDGHVNGDLKGCEKAFVVANADLLPYRTMLLIINRFTCVLYTPPYASVPWTGITLAWMGWIYYEKRGASVHPKKSEEVCISSSSCNTVAPESQVTINTSIQHGSRHREHVKLPPLQTDTAKSIHNNTLTQSSSHYVQNIQHPSRSDCMQATSEELNELQVLLQSKKKKSLA